jgi:hypothetical protein
MTTPINLTQLRKQVNRLGTIDDPETLHALIDTAEAAIELFDLIDRGFTDNGRLRETLNHYTTNP